MLRLVVVAVGATAQVVERVQLIVADELVVSVGNVVVLLLVVVVVMRMMRMVVMVVVVVVVVCALAESID